MVCGGGGIKVVIPPSPDNRKVQILEKKNILIGTQVPENRFKTRLRMSIEHGSKLQIKKEKENCVQGRGGGGGWGRKRYPPLNTSLCRFIHLAIIFSNKKSK